MIKSHTPTQISAVYRKHVLLNAKMTIYNDWFCLLYTSDAADE